MLISKSNKVNDYYLNSGHSLEFALFSANIQHISNLSTFEELSNIYEQSKVFQKIQASYDVGNRSQKLSTHFFDTLKITSFIVTFHFGMYRILPLKMVNDGYKLCIPVAKQILDSQRKYYTFILGVERAKNITLLDAEDPFLFLKIAKYLKLGYHTLCYLDGGSGVQNLHPEKKRSQVKIPFGHGHIFSKISFLKFAYMFNLPVALYIQTGDIDDNERDNNTLKIYPKLPNDSPSSYAKRVIAKIYSDFGYFLLKNPEMWECWFHLHQSNRPKSDLSHWDTVNRFAPYILKGSYFILDKYSYKSYATSREKLDDLLII